MSAPLTRYYPSIILRGKDPGGTRAVACWGCMYAMTVEFQGACRDEYIGGKLGIVVGESTPLYSTVLIDLEAEQLVKTGSHVVASDGYGCRIGVVEMLLAGSDMLHNNSIDYIAIDSIVKNYNEDVTRSLYMRARVKWLSYVDPILNGKVETPKRPVKPGAEISLASSALLRRIFDPLEDGWLKLGKLATGAADFSIRVSRLMRHLAILAVTGGGKSNTVCVLARRLVSTYRATVVIFDVHGEYARLQDYSDIPINVMNGALNPVAVNYSELFQLLGLPGSAHQQRRLLRWMWVQVLALYNRGRMSSNVILDKIEEVLESLANRALQNTSKPLTPDEIKDAFEKVIKEKPPIDRNPPAVKLDQILGVLSKLEDMKYYGSALNPGIPSKLEGVILPGHLNVMDLSSLDEYQIDAVVSHYLRRILEERKAARRGAGGYPTPIIIVIEEAHTLIPKDEDTLSRYWAARIAREGRKFGVGIVIVSQRPKKLDSDVLSQTNNKIILRMVEPSDISYVQAATEEMSEDIARLLPTLDTGEAVVLGSMAKLPALVKIDKCDVETGGTDIDPVKEWRSWHENEKRERPPPEEVLQEYM